MTQQPDQPASGNTEPPAPYSLFPIPSPLLTDHRTIGIQYLILALISVIIGTLLSLLMRIHLVWPAWPLWLHGPILPEDYLALVTIHGTIMLFFVLTTAPQAGFGNLILPAQIGARRMAFPVLNAASFWLTAVALLTLLSSTFVPGGSAISGWTAYPPLSAVPSAGPGQALGMDLWLSQHRPLRHRLHRKLHQHPHHHHPQPLRRHDLGAPSPHRLGMVHRRSPQHHRLLRPPRRHPASLLRPPRRHQLLPPHRRPRQRQSSTAAATAAPSSGSISSGSSDTPRSTSPSSPASASPPCSSPTSATAESSPTAP